MPRYSWAVRVLVFGLIVVGLQADQRQEKLLNVKKLVTSSKVNHEFLEALESRLLNMFGLKSRPKPKRNIKIPKYMLDLYKQHASFSDWQSVSLNLRHTSSANTVRSHTHQETGQEDMYGLNRVKFKFNISSLSEYELLKAAELRIFRQQLDNIVNSSFKCKNCNKQRIQIYDILRPATRRSEALLRLIDTKVVDIRQTKWESFDILPAVLRWREDPTTNYGLYVQVNSLGGKETPIEHVRLKRTAAESSVLCEDYWLQRQPLLITYSDDGHHSTSMRFRRSARKHRRKGKKDNCRRHDLYVDFSDVGWNDWIVAPPGYDAYYCHGECPFPLADHLNSTNHAIVQTLVNSVNPTAVPGACCVPTELSPISMLYVDEYDKVVLKNYQDMVVEGCGCR